MNPNAWLEQIAPRLNEAWRGGWKAGMTEPGRYLYDHELVIVTKGSCRVRVKEVEHELSAGTFLIIPPGVLHSTITNRGGVHRSCFHFDWVRPKRSRGRLPIWVYHPARIASADIKRAPQFVPPRLWTGRFDLAGPVPLLMQTIFYRWQAGSEKDRGANHFALAEVLLQLLWKLSTGRPPRERARLAYAVKELLDRTLAESTAIQPMLASLGFSYAHLCRVFKARYGISPVQYQNVARLEQAKNLLRDPRKTIAEVAYACGFNDPAYFSRKFREVHGMAPSQARL